MAVNDLKDFTMMGLVGGLLMFLLLSFAVGYMYFNNPTGLGDETNKVFEAANTNITTNLIESTDDANKVLNITANTNPEASELGSRDSVSSSYSTAGDTKKTFETAKILFAWVFTGTTGQVLLVTLGTIFAFLMGFFIYKTIRGWN